MRKILFFLSLTLMFSSCISIAPRHHRHTHLFHKRPIMTPNYWEWKYAAPSKVYRKRGF